MDSYLFLKLTLQARSMAKVLKSTRQASDLSSKPHHHQNEPITTTTKKNHSKKQDQVTLP
jgi:hypothetical protein